MEASPRRGGGLHAFRLDEVPVELRIRAAERLARGGSPATADDPATTGTDRLFARLLADRAAGGDSTSAATLRRVAEHPSPRVYWVSRAAWERVMLAKRRRK